MILDHRPYWLLKLHEKAERRYANWFLAPQFESLGPDAVFMRPWNVNVNGGHIRAGKNLHLITDRDRKVTFSTWTLGEHQGQIQLGDNVLVCPGCRFDSASSITIGDNCMLAAGSYITDADWHDIYDRTQAIGMTRPVVLGDNVWLGDGAMICKGVSIGDNTVIGARSLVTSDIPANVIAAGNPASIIRPLDEGRELTTRASIFADMNELNHRMDGINRWMLNDNSLAGWIRSKVKPRQGD